MQHYSTLAIPNPDDLVFGRAPTRSGRAAEWLSEAGTYTRS